MNFSILLVILVTVMGVFLLFRLRFFYIIHPIRTYRELIQGLKNRDVRRSFLLALAGTLGVGNIYGVAAGIMIGGPGSLFWLLVSSLFAMIIKYAETLLVFDSGAERGAMASLVRRVFHGAGRGLSLIYAFFTLLLAFFMGSAMQTGALVDAAEKTFLVHPLITVFILLILFSPCLIGGAQIIESITEIVIPLTTIIYTIACFAVIFLNFDRLGVAIQSIFSSAFSFKSTLGGGISFIALREGFSRGILSNEAGVGTSAMAHIRSKGRSPHSAGLFAMCEVVFDSLLLCMLTGIAILVSPLDISKYLTPMSLVSAAFSSTLGQGFAMILPFIIFAFAYATFICWYYYGMDCVAFSFPRLMPFYTPLFLLFAFLSSVIKSDFLLYVIDFILLVMSFITLSCIAKRSRRIADISFNEYRKNPE